MAEVYKCDACSVMIDRPYDVQMKEFYIGCSFESYGVVPVNSRRKVKVHLCDECFKGLKMIARNLRRAEDGN